MMNKEIYDWLTIKKMKQKELAALIGRSYNYLSHLLRYRELTDEEKKIIYRAISTGKKQTFPNIHKCKVCGELFEAKKRQYICPECVKLRSCPQSKKERPKKSRVFSITELSRAAKALDLSYGQLEDKLHRNLIDRKTIEKLIKQ